MANPQYLSPVAFKPIAAPSSPAAGWCYFDSTTNRWTGYDGSAWQVTVSRADLNGNTLPASVTTLATSGLASLNTMQTGNVSSSQGNPVTSGTTQTSGVFRMRDGNAVLDGGANGTVVWLQATDATNLALNYQLNLNPNGGLVNIGAGGLTVGGNTSVTGTFGVTGNATITGSMLATLGYGWKNYTNLGSSTTVLDFSNGALFIDMAANRTFTATNATANTMYMMVLRNTSASAVTATFPASFSLASSSIGAGTNTATFFQIFYTGSKFIVLNLTSIASYASFP